MSLLELDLGIRLYVGGLLLRFLGCSPLMNRLAHACC